VHWWKVWFKPVTGGVIALAVALSTAGVAGVYLQLAVFNGLFVILLFLLGIFGKQEISSITSWINKRLLPGNRA
jgi:hypothetical protein